MKSDLFHLMEKVFCIFKRLKTFCEASQEKYQDEEDFFHVKAVFAFSLPKHV